MRRRHQAVGGTVQQCKRRRGVRACHGLWCRGPGWVRRARAGLPERDTELSLLFLPHTPAPPRPCSPPLSLFRLSRFHPACVVPARLCWRAAGRPARMPKACGPPDRPPFIAPALSPLVQPPPRARRRGPKRASLLVQYPNATNAHPRSSQSTASKQTAPFQAIPSSTRTEQRLAQNALAGCGAFRRPPPPGAGGGGGHVRVECVYIPLGESTALTKSSDSERERPIRHECLPVAPAQSCARMLHASWTRCGCACLCPARARAEPTVGGDPP